MSTLHPDIYHLGDITNPVETIDMSSPPTDTAAIEIFRAHERGWFPRYVAFFYSCSNLTKTTGVATGVPRVGSAVNAPPGAATAGIQWYFPPASSSGGPFYQAGSWIYAGTTAINLHGDTITAFPHAGFLLGFPASGGTTSFGECEPIQFPVGWLELTMTGWTTGTFTWWATLIK